MTTESLPSPVARYIAATNAFDLDGMMATFTDDALVNDHRCDFPGSAAIRAWAAREIVGDRVTMDVVSGRAAATASPSARASTATSTRKGCPIRSCSTFTSRTTRRTSSSSSSS